MLAEKKSLKRFLLIYILSTFLLLGIGEWFYFKSKYHFEIDNQVTSLANELKLYLIENKGMLRNLRFSQNKQINANFNIAVYKNGEYFFGNFKPQKVYINKEFWINKGKIYYIYSMPKRWGKINIVVSKKLDKSKINLLIKEIIIFNILVLIFIVIIAYFLGRLFLMPLKNSIEKLENFIRDSMHEMNLPISVILTNIEMLKLSGIENKQLKRIDFSAKRLEKIFKDLAFVRFNHQQKKEIQKIDIKKILKERILIFQTMLENKKIELIKDCENLVIEIDKEDLIRLIDNILSNAIKYSPNNEKIFITLKENRFEMKNIGVIKNEKKIYSKFYRENQVEGGFGLGLYIVKKICEYYGFEFIIKNENKFVKSVVLFRNSLT